jgi:hypothetical protein
MNRLILFFLLVYVGIGPLSSQDISEKEVARILKTLSADEMMGRATFTEGIEKAARFLEQEFASAKLKPLPGQKGFRQEFSIFSVKGGEGEVVINGVEYLNHEYFVMADGPGISWTQPDLLKVYRVGPNDNLRQVFSQVRRDNLEALVLVHTSQKPLFDRFSSFFTRGGNKFELGKEANQVFVLTDEVEVQTLQVDIKNVVSSRPLSNVGAMIPGKRKNEYVLFSAHYDHIGIQRPVNGDSIANGANDDASGTTAVVALAKYFQKMKKPERTLLFVCFTAEEIGGYGSQYFSKQVNPDHIVAMFNIEMIGKPATDGPNSAWITGFDKSDFGTLLQKSTEGTPYKFYADPYPDQNLFYRSDNATLARLGVPAHTISTTPIDVDPDYHQVSDEFETIHIPHMTSTIRAIAKAAAGIVSGRDTPARVDTSQVD